ncbi:MAG: hypothetical protein KF901_17280 [Myxococcales bacterium]|nr:hypothetical protein [Myxococcales bacterium]
MIARVLLVLALTFSLARSSHAQDDEVASAPTERDSEARALYQAAVVAFDEGRFEDALRLFRRAYELSERPELLFNVGTTADRLRRDEEALEAFEAYLAARPDAANRASVEARIEVLREAISNERAAPTEARPVVLIHDYDERPTEPARRKWWIGVLVAAVVVAGAATLAVVLATRGRSSGEDPPHDASFATLGRW